MLMITGKKRKSYTRKIKALFGTSVIGYWPMFETGGSSAIDFSGNGRNCTYTGGARAAGTSPMNKPAPSFSAPAGGVYLGGSASYLAAFNGNEGTFICNIKLPAATWNDGTHDLLLNMPAAVDILEIKKYANGKYIRIYRSGSADNKSDVAYMYPTEWVNVCCTWSLSGGYMRIYHNGIRNKTAATVAITGSFGGAWTAVNCRVAAASATAFPLRGQMSDAVILNRAVTDAEALAVSKMLLPQCKTLSLLGDSISADLNNLIYPTIIQNEFQGGLFRKINHAVSGQRVVTHMAAQAAATAGDGANICIMALGTNDDNAGNMANLQAIAEAGIDKVRANNPGVVIYYLNVLPCWTNNGGGTVVNKANIRAAIAAACAAKGVTCWETFTVPWITAADTTDGLHPTIAGHGKIATQILARL